jgi:hypothetical protein
MTAISAFFRKTPVLRLKEYFTSGGFTSLAPVDWTKPEADVVEPLIKAVDGMTDDERQRVVLDAGRVAALADEPGQNALQNVVLNRAIFDTLEGANNRSLWVFLNENDRFRLAEEVRYNDERRRTRSWNGFEVEKDCTARRDPISVAAFTKAIRDRFDTPHVHVDIFDRHRVILEDQECDLVQVAVYREGRPEDILGFDANSTLSRRILKPVFEASLTYEADTGVIEVVANTLEDRRDLTAYMARDLLGIDFKEKPIPLREYDLSMLLKPFDFPTDVKDGKRTALDGGRSAQRADHSRIHVGCRPHCLGNGRRAHRARDRQHRACPVDRVGDAGMDRYPRPVHDQVPTRPWWWAWQIPDADRDHATWLQPQGHDPA